MEWRNKSTLGGILLYVTGAVYICYMSFQVKRGIVHPITWNALFWIIILFSSVNAVSKSFQKDQGGRSLYLYSLVSPQALIVAKILYNFFLMSLLTGIGYVSYCLVMQNPVQDHFLFILCLLLSAVGFASSLTLIAAISSRTSNNGTLMAILSFPVIMPILLLIIKISKNAIDGLDREASYDELLVLGALDVIVFTTSWILFPFLWRN